MYDVIKEATDLRHLRWSRKPVTNSTEAMALPGLNRKNLTSCEIISGRLVYYKLSGYDPQLGIVGSECVYEIIACRLMDLMGIRHVDYTLMRADVDIDGHIFRTWVCRWEDYRQSGESAVTLDEYYESKKLYGETPINFCIRKRWADYISRMLLVDYVILNRDRSWKNIMVLKDGLGRRLRLSPLSEHGCSFMEPEYLPSDYIRYDSMSDTRVRSFLGAVDSRHNLYLIPNDQRKKLLIPAVIDKCDLFDGLHGILDEDCYDLIWDMVSHRMNYARAFLNGDL